jgi:transcriptional regulator with XRE-family HTH domain
MAAKKTVLPAKDYTKQDFADAVAKARTARGWSQTKLADHASEFLPAKERVTQADVSQIEKLKSYGLKKAVAVATALDIAPPREVPNGEPAEPAPPPSTPDESPAPGVVTAPAAPAPPQKRAPRAARVAANEPVSVRRLKRGEAIDQMDEALDGMRRTCEGILTSVDPQEVPGVVELTQRRFPELSDWIAKMAPRQGASPEENA